MKTGGRYAMEGGQIVVDSIKRIRIKDITDTLALKSGFDGVADLLKIARHGSGKDDYLVRFHYLPPGAWDAPLWPTQR